MACMRRCGRLKLSVAVALKVLLEDWCTRTVTYYHLLMYVNVIVYACSGYIPVISRNKARHRIKELRVVFFNAEVMKWQWHVTKCRMSIHKMSWKYLEWSRRVVRQWRDWRLTLRPRCACRSCHAAGFAVAPFIPFLCVLHFFSKNLHVQIVQWLIIQW